MELQTKQPPELEFSMPEVEESLTAYLSAIGGAIIGLLLTLLVLAIWNGGTLNFTNASKVNALEAGLTDVAADVEMVNANFDALGQRIIVLEQEAGAVAALQNSLAALDSSLSELDRTLDAQGIHLGELDGAVEDLQVTRRNFDLFTAALADALALMEGNASDPQPQSGAPSQRSQSSRPSSESPSADNAGSSISTRTSNAPLETRTQPATALPEPARVVDQDLAPDVLLIYLFLDVNADGTINDDENLIAGATVILTAPDGRTVAPQNNVGSAGALFEDLMAGEYTITVDEVQGYTLASQNTAAITVDPEAVAGQALYFPVVTTAVDE